MRSRKNTLQEGVVRCLVYQLSDDASLYYATALEFNLTVSAESDDLALLELREQIKEYVATAREEDAPELLNQEIDEDLEDAWMRIINTGDQKREKASQLMPVYATASPITAIAV